MTTLPQTAPMRPPRSLPGSALAAPGHAGPSPSQAAAQNAMTAADVWRVIRANVLIILLVLLFSAALGVGLHFWLAMKYSRFTSTGLVQVKMKNEWLNLDAGHQSGVTPADLEIEKGTQVKLFLHETLRAEVLEHSDQIRDTDWFKQFITVRNGQKGFDAEAAKADLDSRLTVQSVPDSRLISVKIDWSNPKDCQTMVTEIVNQRIKDQKTADDDNDLKTTAQIQSLKFNYEQQIHDGNGRMAAIAIELGTMGVQVGAGMSSKDYELTQLVTEDLKARAFYGAAVAKLETFKRQLETNSAPELDEAVQKNPRYNDYRRRVEELETDYAYLVMTLGKNNTKAIAIENQLQETRKKLTFTEEEAKSRTATLILANLENDAKASESAIERIKKRMGEVRQEIAEVATKRNEYSNLEGQVIDLRGKIEKLKEQQDRISTVTNSTKSGLIDWDAHPDLPDHPSFPKWYFVVPLTVMVGLALSLGLAFLREMTDTTVRTPRDIARVGQMTLLGMIPHENDDPEAAGARLPLAIFEAPHSIIAEQFRHVRTRLQHAASLDTTRSILITGCSAEDGKTTVAVNLAAGLALNGRRILLVDANFRRPDLHNVFNCGNDVGFGDVLNDPEMFQDVVSDTEVPNLALITTGTRPSNPTELLESQLLIDFIERALEEYDHVIFDSGPLLMVSDTIALAPRVDGVITVVRATGNSRGMLGRMRDELRRLKAEHLGVVLNAVRVHGGGYYGAMIKNYYGYQND